MANTLTADEFFADVQSQPKGQSADDFFADIEQDRNRIIPPPAGLEGTPDYKYTRDELADSTAMGRILDAWWMGAREMWGDTPIGPTQKDREFAEKYGLAPDANDSLIPSTAKQIPWSIYSAGAMAIESLFRAPQAAFGAATGAAVQTIQEFAGNGEQSVQDIASIAQDPTRTMSGPAGDLVNAMNVAGMTIPGATVGPIMFRPGIPKTAAPILPYVGHSEKVYQGLESPPKDIAARGEGIAAVMDVPITIKLAEKPKPPAVATPPKDAPFRWQNYEVGSDKAGVYVRYDNGFGDIVEARGDGVKGFKNAKEAEAFAKEKQARYLAAEVRAAQNRATAETTPPTTASAAEAKAPNVSPDPVRTVDESYIAAAKVGNVQLSRMKDWTEAQKKAVEERYDTSGISSELHTRGVVTIADMEQIARDTPYEVKDLINRKIGEAYNAEQFMKHSQGITKLWEEFDELGEKIQDVNASDQMHLDFMLKMHELDTAIANFVGAKAEWGRAGAAQRALYDQIKKMEDVEAALKEAATPEAKATLSKSKTTPEDIVNNLGGKEKIKQTAQRIKASKNKKEKSKKIRAAAEPTWGDKAREVLYSLGMLSNPITWGVNALGSAMTAFMDVGVTTPLAAAIGSAKGLVGLKNPDRVYWTAAGAKALGLFVGAPEGLKAAFRYLATEQATYGTNKVQTGAIQGIPGRAVRAPGITPIAATDEFFKAIVNNASAVEQAHTIALKEGLKPGTRAYNARTHEILSNPSQEIIVKAAQEANYHTFNEDLGKFGKAYERMMNQGEIGRWSKFLLTPFLRTTVGIKKYGLDFSPLSPLLGRNRDILMGKEGIAARDKLVAKMVVGSGLIYWAWQKAANGELTDSGPADRNQNAVWVEEGNEPNSLKLFDWWLPIGNMDPFAQILTATASLHRAKDAYLSDDDAADLGATLMVSAHDILINRTWFNTPADLMDAVDEKNGLKAELFVGNVLSRGIPAGSSLITNYVDPGIKDVRSVLDVLMSKTAVTVDDLETKVDIFGNDITRNSILSQEKPNPYAKAMREAEYFPAPVDRTVHAQGMGMVRGVELTPEQYRFYKKVAGQYLAWAMKSTIDSVGFAQWNKLPLGVRREELKRAGSHARELATKELLMKYKSITEEAWKNKSIDYGLGWPE